jgi:hypothetical protein
LVPLVTTIALLIVVASVVLFFFAFVRIWLSMRRTKDGLLSVAGTKPYLDNTKLVGLALAGFLFGMLLIGILEWTGMAAA